MELRAAAGLAPPPAAVNLDQRVGAALRIGRERLDAVDRRLGRFLGYDRLSDYLRLLRPAWWVLRGYLVAMLVTVFTSGTSHGLLPRLGDSTLAALLLLAVTIPASIWLGRRSDRLGRRPRWLLNAATVLLVGFGLIGLVNYTQMSYRYAPVPGGLHRPVLRGPGRLRLRQRGPACWRVCGCSTRTASRSGSASPGVRRHGSGSRRAASTTTTRTPAT